MALKKSPAQLNREIAEALSSKLSLKGRPQRHHSTMSDDEKIRAAIAKFPPTFELRGFPGDVFRLSPTSSYVSGQRVVLYTQRKDGNQWLDFSKGSESELRGEVTSATRNRSSHATVGFHGYENGERVAVIGIGNGRVRSGDNYPESNEHWTYVTMTLHGETTTEAYPTRQVVMRR